MLKASKIFYFRIIITKLSISKIEFKAKDVFVNKEILSSILLRSQLDCNWLVPARDGRYLVTWYCLDPIHESGMLTSRPCLQTFGLGLTKYIGNHFHSSLS